MNKHKFSTKMLAVMSILVALEVIIARFGTIRPTESIKISLDFIPIVAAAILYGPVPAVIISILADVLGAFLFPVGPYFPGFTLTAAMTGLLYGLLLDKNQRLYGLPYLPTLTARLVQAAIVTTVQLVMIPLIAKTVKEAEKRAQT